VGRSFAGAATVVSVNQFRTTTTPESVSRRVPPGVSAGGPPGRCAAHMSPLARVSILLGGAPYSPSPQLRKIGRCAEVLAASRGLPTASTGVTHGMWSCCNTLRCRRLDEFTLPANLQKRSAGIKVTCPGPGGVKYPASSRWGSSPERVIWFSGIGEMRADSLSNLLAIVHKCTLPPCAVSISCRSIGRIYMFSLIGQLWFALMFVPTLLLIVVGLDHFERRILSRDATPLTQHRSRRPSHRRTPLFVVRRRP
jgi:hypothetical protein